MPHATAGCSPEAAHRCSYSPLARSRTRTPLLLLVARQKPHAARAHCCSRAARHAPLHGCLAGVQDGDGDHAGVGGGRHGRRRAGLRGGRRGFRRHAAVRRGLRRAAVVRCRGLRRPAAGLHGRGLRRPPAVHGGSGLHHRAGLRRDGDGDGTRLHGVDDAVLGDGGRGLHGRGLGGLRAGVREGHHASFFAARSFYLWPLSTCSS